MDVTASLFLADGRECKVITGIDDHSRFCVIATVVQRATARAVCLAFAAAMAEYGIPGEVLSDNGKQFTGRFGKPRPAEVLFERICRENGITQRLTKPRSPTTTGKIERLHQTLQLELLNVHGPFASSEDAQAAVDAWRKDYNTGRPHQSLAMAYPAARFTPAADAIGLRVPAELTRQPPPSVPAPAPGPADSAARSAQDTGSGRQGQAVELDRLVPPSGNLWVAGQQIWLGPAMTGRTVRLWAGLDPGPRPARRPPDQDPAAPPARTPDRDPAGVGARVGHGRRPEGPGRAVPRPQNRPGHHRTRHLPGHRRARYHRHRGPHHQPRHPAAQGL